MEYLKRVCSQTGLFVLILFWGFTLIHPLSPSIPEQDKISSTSAMTGNQQGKGPQVLPNDNPPFVHRGELTVKQESNKNFLYENIASIIALTVFIFGSFLNLFISQKQEKRQKEQIETQNRGLEQQKLLTLKEIDVKVRSGYRQDRMKVFRECLSELLADAAVASNLLQQKEKNKKENKEISNDIEEKTNAVVKNLIFHKGKIDLLFYDIDERAQNLNNSISLLLKVVLNEESFDFKEFRDHREEIVKLGKEILSEEWQKLITIQ